MVDLLKHNQEAYERIKSNFEVGNKTCIVHPTGTGKSYLILKLIEDYKDENKNIIIIEPQKYIFQQLKEKMEKYELPEDRVKFITYSALGRLDIDKLNSLGTPCMVIFDEMHRAGAATWSKGVAMMFDNFPIDCKYIGLSATPIRYLDNKRDMCAELFDGCVASEISLADAIIRRILPLVRYIAGLYSYDNEFEKITRKIQQSCNEETEKQELLQEAKLMKRNLDCSEGISSIFKRYIMNDKGKYVAFCRDIKHLKEMRASLEEWFSKADIQVNLYEVHCKNPEKDAEFQAFKEDTEFAVCLSVAMLAEGLHGIDGVILLRDTISPNLYYQQIGRAFAVEMESVPVIFDLVANCESVMDCSLKNDLIEAINRRDVEKKDRADIDGTNDGKDEITREDIEKFFVFDQVIDAVSAFRSIEERLQGSWELMFDKYCNFYKENGHGDVPNTNEYRKLSIWCKHQRQDFSSRLLKENRENLLNANDFIWDVPKYRFEQNIMRLKKYISDNGQYPKSSSQNKYESNLGYFVSAERTKKRVTKAGNTYPQWKEIIMEEILPDFCWEPLEESFNEFLYYYKDYKKQTNKCYVETNVVFKGYPLGKQYRCIKGSIKKGNLPEYKKQALFEVGINSIDIKDLRYEENWKLLKEISEQKLYLTSTNRIYKGVDVYSWFKGTVQKRIKEGEELSDDKNNIILKVFGSIRPVKGRFKFEYADADTDATDKISS